MDTPDLIAAIVDQVRHVAGINAIVLGGSRARGTHTAASDIDLGIYYQGGLDLDALDRVATALDDHHRPGTLTAIGGWGPWINGGGWLTIHGQPVDFIYRDLDQVERVIDACCSGQVDIVYQPGHPHGFVTAIYLAEVALCRPLWTADAWLATLRQRTSPYPPALRKAMTDRFGWEISFALATARKGIARADTAYAAGCCFRAVMCLLHVIFAANGQHWMNEKGATAIADTFPLRPLRLRARIDEAFTKLAADGASIEAAIAILEDLHRDTDAVLVGAG